jgi:D-alanyl-D-alanine-carboxypeptidase/D-alanyl-D-alanine-endopeptidase
MNGQRCTLTLLSMAVNCCVGVPIASSQNLTDQWVEKAAGPLVENRVVDGLSVGYIEGEHYGIVHLGTANQAKEKANNLTVYEIGSVSKVFTSLLLADAVVRGEINLNAAADVANPAGIRLPSRDGTSIQWIDLSTHRSGLPRLPSNLPLTDSTNPYRDYDSKKASEFLNHYELPRQPGKSQEYSNVGGSVLGFLVAEKAGKSYEELLRERIAKPLRMTDCTVSLSDDQVKRLAKPHDKFGSATSTWTFADLPGAGGVHASMRDMMRFAKAQLNPPSGPLGEAIDLAWKQHTEADASGPAMGLGWMIAGDGQTRWHNGQTGGSHAALFINREFKCAVVVLCNTAVANEVDQLASQLLLKAAGQEVKPGSSEAFPKKSPFAAVRWRESQTEVKVGEQWYKLVSLDGLPAAEIVAFSRKTFDSKWQMRFEEDLVELLSRMGHPPQDTVKLVVQSLTSKETQALKDIPMTEANRDAIKAAAQDRARSEPESSDTSKHDSDKPAIDAKLRRRLVGRYQLKPSFIFDVRDVDGHLMVGITNQPTQEVYPDSPTRWSYHGVDATLEFNLTKTGPAKSLILHQNGIKQTARRIK